MEILKNFSLALVSLILAAFLIPIGIIIAFIFFIVKLEWDLFVKFTARFFRSIALSVDKLGNYSCAVLFNLCLLKQNERMYRFGRDGETISSCLGKNLKLNNLNDVGLFLNKILNFFEKDHAIKSIDSETSIK